MAVRPPTLNTDEILLVGNWKMWPASATEAVRVARAHPAPPRGVRIALAPPLPFLAPIKEVLPRRVWLAAQGAGEERDEAEETEATSAAMRASLGVRITIVGHADVRRRGKDNEEIAREVRAAITHGMAAVVCVGEHARDEQGSHFHEVRYELHASLVHVPKTQWERVFIAYEPRWAIGSRARSHASPAQVQEMVVWIRKVLAERIGARQARTAPVLYGGSVREELIAPLLEIGVRGFLVGRASRDPRQWKAIINAAAAARRRATLRT